MHFIKDMKENERIIEHYLCKKKESRESRSGKSFLSLKLQDRTGTVDAKIWEMTSDIQQFDEGDIVKIDGTVGSFQNELQIKILKIRRSREGEYVANDYIPATEKDIGEMFEKLKDLIKTIKNAQLRKMIENIFFNESYAKMFKSHSAAMYMHHGYLGGLLEHTLSVAETCVFLGARYKYVNTDILLAGALLHDIGKIYELSPLPQNEYTDDGQMLGHIILGLELVTAEIAKIENFPRELASLLKHCIIAHHGELEYGSPKVPATPEAMILHFADNIDAKLQTFTEVYEKDTTPGLWTAYQKSLSRYIRKPGAL